MGSLASDLRFALRAFRREPGFFAMAIATLALPARRAARLSPLEALR